jgi:hypothetical protein
VKVSAIAPAEVVVCMARSLAGGSVCSTWGMLFVAMVKGRLDGGAGWVWFVVEA